MGVFQDTPSHQASLNQLVISSMNVGTFQKAFAIKKGPTRKQPQCRINNRQQRCACFTLLALTCQYARALLALPRYPGKEGRVGLWVVGVWDPGPICLFKTPGHHDPHYKMDKFRASSILWELLNPLQYMYNFSIGSLQIFYPQWELSYCFPKENLHQKSCKKTCGAIV